MKRKGTSRALLDLKHTAYEENREAIVADLLSIGRTLTVQRWRIPKGTIGKLIHRWLTPEQKEIMRSAPQASPVVPTPSKAPTNGRLPAFPEFSGTWEAPVQLKWLEVYEKLSTEVHNKP